MTPEAQINAIAEACPNIEHLGNLLSNEETALYAMHEAEKHLTHQQWNDYYEYLFEMCGTKGVIRATAPQRREAFLRTIVKWIQ